MGQKTAMSAASRLQDKGERVKAKGEKEAETRSLTQAVLTTRAAAFANGVKIVESSVMFNSLI